MALDIALFVLESCSKSHCFCPIFGLILILPLVIKILIINFLMWLIKCSVKLSFVHTWYIIIYTQNFTNELILLWDLQNWSACIYATVALHFFYNDHPFFGPFYPHEEHVYGFWSRLEFIIKTSVSEMARINSWKDVIPTKWNVILNSFYILVSSFLIFHCLLSWLRTTSTFSALIKFNFNRE